MEKKIGEELEKRLIGREKEIVSQPERKKKSLLMNQTRQLMLQYLCKYPCSRLEAISKDLELTAPTVKWHLEKMTDSSFISLKKVGRTAVFYPSNMTELSDIEILAVLNLEKTGFIFSVILEKGGIAQNELCKLVGASPQAVIRYTSRLEKLGLVNSVGDGRYKRYYATSLISELQESRGKRTKYFREYILGKLKDDALRPQIIRSTDKEILVRITAGGKEVTLELKTSPFTTVPLKHSSRQQIGKYLEQKLE